MRHFTRPRRNFHVRLACVRHAASVQSEPESNSPVEKYDSVWITNIQTIELKALIIIPISLFNYQRPVLSNQSRPTCMVSAFSLQENFSKWFSQSARSVYTLFIFVVKNFFSFFENFSEKLFWASQKPFQKLTASFFSCRRKFLYEPFSNSCQQFFFKFFLFRFSETFGFIPYQVRFRRFLLQTFKRKLTSEPLLHCPVRQCERLYALFLSPCQTLFSNF